MISNPTAKRERESELNSIANNSVPEVELKLISKAGFCVDFLSFDHATIKRKQFAYSKRTNKCTTGVPLPRNSLTRCITYQDIFIIKLNYTYQCENEPPTHAKKYYRAKCSNRFFQSFVVFHSGTSPTCIQFPFISRASSNTGPCSTVIEKTM